MKKLITLILLLGLLTACQGRREDAAPAIPAEGVGNAEDTTDTASSDSNDGDTAGNVNDDSNDDDIPAKSDTSARADADAILQCVMVNGTIFQNTGYKSSAIGCGNTDGEIKTTVESSHLPSENDQSNFGVGYTYQYGTEEQMIVFIDGEPFIFRNIDAEDTDIPNEVLHFTAEIKEIREQDIIVTVHDVPGIFLFQEGDYAISASMFSENLSIGDSVMVWCDNYVQESLPAILPSVYRISLIKEE